MLHLLHNDNIKKARTGVIGNTAESHSLRRAIRGAADPASISGFGDISFYKDPFVHMVTKNAPSLRKKLKKENTLFRSILLLYIALRRSRDLFRGIVSKDKSWMSHTKTEDSNDNESGSQLAQYP
jgi:hypothetical protein